MNSRHNEFESFYDDQVAAYRQFYSRENILDRFGGSTIALTIAVLLVTLLIRFYSPDGTVQGIASATGNFLWDALVFIVPAPLLLTADQWINSSASPRPMIDTQQSTHAAKSDALRRVMGLDRPGGMMSTVFRARTRALSMTGSILGLKTESDRPPGLGNLDNSCYQNSILQGLASLESMPGYLMACVRDIDENGQDAEPGVAQTLRMLISDLNNASNNGRTLWTPELLKSMSTWTQQDAQEYYSKILDDIDKGAAVAAKARASDRIPGLEESDFFKDESSASQHSDDSGYQSLSSSSKLSDAKPVRNPLEGLLAQRVACVQCGHADGLSIIPFNCLTLSLGLDKNQHDLYERLDSYSRVETIEGVDCPKCTLLKAKRLLTKLVERMQEAGGSSQEQLAEPQRRLEAVETALEDDEFDEDTITNKCKISAQGRVSTTKTKQMVIARPPQSLVIHVNRSVFDPSTFNMIKNSAPVSFPMMLDLGPWCLGSADQKVGAERTASGSDEDSEEQWQLDAMESMVAGDLRPSRLTGPIYELRAAVTHYGRHENGHYVCYRKYPLSSSPSSEATDDDQAVPSAKASIDGGVDKDHAGPKPSTTDDGRVGDEEVAWWRLSDHNVARVDDETVMSLSPGVFMLFYECVDPSVILQSEGEMADARSEAATTQERERDEAPETVSSRRDDAIKPGEAKQAMERPNGESEVQPKMEPLPTADGEKLDVAGEQKDGV